MKVTGSKGTDLTKIYRDNRPKEAHGRDKTDKKYDRIEISKEGLEIAKYASMVKDMPDTRLHKVEEIKARIEDGAYRASPEEIASAMLKAVKEENI